ncbi:Bestrophin, RFP-TM, chloride channel-domain-containing protein [Halenospora varia]|nr:Bestrophin, RFP-TM, chloride channel-domain-containing protein [Halenospora varia]
MISQHHHPYHSLRAWHAGQREKRINTRWVPYSLRLEGGGFLRIMPQILLSGVVAALIGIVCQFMGDELSLHSPILFPIFGFVVGLAITFRMQSSYNRWWEGRVQWDKISAVSRSFARTLWIHVPTERKLEDLGGLGHGKQDAIKCVHILAVALKHHLRGERDWDECGNLKQLLATLPNYNFLATNHPLTITMHLASYVERYRTETKVDTQVLTHLLTHIDTFTAIISACERLLRTPIPLGYNIAISRIVWIFVIALPSQLWGEFRWWSIAVTMVTAYALFVLAEVGLEIENPWGAGPNDLDLDRYCNLLALDLNEIVAYPYGSCSEAVGSGTKTPLSLIDVHDVDGEDPFSMFAESEATSMA